jgi:hypothetical protein
VRQFAVELLVVARAPLVEAAPSSSDAQAANATNQDT